MSDDRLAEIRARLDACDTPQTMWRNVDVLYTKADYDLIAHAPSDIAWLLSEVERLTHQEVEAGVRTVRRDESVAQGVTERERSQLPHLPPYSSPLA